MHIGRIKDKEIAFLTMLLGQPESKIGVVRYRKKKDTEGKPRSEHFVYFIADGSPDLKGIRVNLHQ